MAYTTILLSMILWAQATPATAADDSAELEFFEKRVRPVLVERCFECHATSSKQVEAGLWLDSREAVLRGGDSGPAAVAGEVEKSRLIEAIRYKSESLQMPPQGKMPDREIQVLEEWVRRGLPFTPTDTVAAMRRTIDLESGRKHWAFQPLAVQPLPKPEDGNTRFTRIDHFVQARLRERGLTPSPMADRRVLLRRASFDLVGLPPTASHYEEFLNDSAPDAYERALERLLASPHYGERWARYWLDLTRYCDVTESWRGGEAKPWLYRDWIVSALNRDLPYDDFVRQQLAADLLPGAVPADNAALGFLGLSPTYWKELKLDHKVIQQVVAEEWEERIEAIGGTFLGLTVACARCHDHKFDPISTHDYYALAGVLANVRLADVPTIAAELANAAQAARAKAKPLQEKWDKLAQVKDPTADMMRERDELRRQLDTLQQTPHFDTPLAPGVSDERTVVLADGQHRTKIEYRAGELQDVAVHIRGNAANPGQVVPRRFLAVLSAAPGKAFSQGSGRRELAESIVVDAAPLAARVLVNRVWGHHFGRGLVATPSNFGATGERPSHPELLDDLAARFVAQGWSLKWLHREIMLSATYRQSSYRDEAGHAIDPDNVWLWRMQPRRLEVEIWRDAILAATGQLDSTLGGPPEELAKADNHRRTVYGQIKRRELTDLLRLHDFPDPVAHSAARISTTTPLQQLFTLNSPLLHQRSLALRDRLDRESPADDTSRVQWLYQTLFGRAAVEQEVARAREFVAGQSRPTTDEAWRQYCHALLASNELLFIE